MSVSTTQTVEDLCKLKDSLGEIIDQLNSSAFGLVGYELSVMHGDLARVTFNLGCACGLEVGE